MNLGKNVNAVLDVNTEDAWPLVEPSVTFFDLHHSLEERGLKRKGLVRCDF